MSYVNENGYIIVDRKREHRNVWSSMYGTIPEGKEIDHINGDRTDNRLANLRLVTRKENMQNSKQYNTNKSGVTGVSWSKSKGKWQANAMVDYKQKFLGRFDDWFEAVCARMSANNRYGFHANHGRR